jgi:predicted permease
MSLAFAFRRIRHAPGVALTAILSLALGIGAVTAIFSVVYGVVLDPFPYKNVGELMSVRVWSPDQPGSRISYTVDQFLEIAGRNRIFTGVTFSTISDVLWTGRDEPQRLRGNFTTYGGLQVMGVPAVAGRIFTGADEGSDVCVLGWRFWQRQLAGDPAAVGRTMLLNGKTRTVIGVMPPRFMWRGADVYVPFVPRRGMREEGIAFVHLTGRLKPGVTEAQVEADLRPIILDLKAREPGSFPEKLRVGVLSFANTFPSGIADVLWMLFAAVALLLLIACANVSNLLLAQAASRAREMAVRASLGATRGTLLRQLLGESLTIALAGAALGVLFAWVGMRGILALVPPFTIPDEAEVKLHLPVLLFTLALSGLTAILFGLVPALEASRGELADPMREGSRGSSAGRRQSRVAGALVVAETALSLVLLTGAGLMVRAMMRMGSLDFGVRTGNVLTMRIPLAAERYPDSVRRTLFFEQLLEKLRSLPQVESVAVNSGFHPFGNRGTQVVVNGVEDTRRVTIHSVSPGYTGLMGIALHQGRELEQGDVAQQRQVALVNEEFVRRYGLRSGGAFRIPEARNRPLLLASDVFEVAGVVADTSMGVRASREPEVYIPHSLGGIANGLLLRPRQGEARALISTARAAVASLDRDQPITDIDTIDTLIARYISAGPKFNVVLFSVFGTLGLLLAVIGIYGLMSNAVARRTREIGLRMAMGATFSDVLRLVFASGGKLLLTGLAAGIVGSYYASRALAAKMSNVPTLDWPAMAAICAALMAAGLAAIAIPARRAARVDPVHALRAE